MESLKTKLRMLRKVAKERSRREYKVQMSSLTRSEDEWKAIDEYLSTVLTEAVEQSDGSRVIHLDSDSPAMCCPADREGKLLKLPSGASLQVNHEDIRRFCKAHGLRFRYMCSKYQNYKILRRVKTDSFTGTYIIKV